jgi:hypothetical protein
MVVATYDHLIKAFNILEFRHILNPKKFVHVKDTQTTDKEMKMNKSLIRFLIKLRLFRIKFIST